MLGNAQQARLFSAKAGILTHNCMIRPEHHLRQVADTWSTAAAARLLGSAIQKGKEIYTAISRVSSLHLSQADSAVRWDVSADG